MRGRQNAPEPEFTRGVQNPPFGLGGDAAALVQHAIDRRDADTRAPRNILQTIAVSASVQCSLLQRPLRDISRLMENHQNRLPLRPPAWAIAAESLAGRGKLMPTTTMDRRDYSLIGPETRRAAERGLASADWYTHPIPRKQMKEL